MNSEALFIRLDWNDVSGLTWKPLSRMATQPKHFVIYQSVWQDGIKRRRITWNDSKFKPNFEMYNTKKEAMIQAEQLFEHSSVSYDSYEEAFQEFLSLEVVFKLYDAQKESRDDWGTISWAYLDSKKLTDGIDEFLAQYNELPNSVRNLPLAKEINKNMKNFKFSVPIMLELKNEALKERHWKEIMLKTGHFFEMSPSKFILSDLFLMNLHLNHEIVHDITGKAMRELNIETSFNSVKETFEKKCDFSNVMDSLMTIGSLFHTDNYRLYYRTVSNPSSQWFHPA
ncbi:dynein axonemal heavy chain 10-like [Halyomorpha halys]|uniref:dynein axonemal heavy chain 10-like n=1 Tax=Halyomorpha halys TaxID=286706 RepID=UPI0034D24290